MNKKMSSFGFYAITSAMVMSVYVYATFATAGLSLVFFLLFSGFIWFLPTALCAAEMATVEGWGDGGIYTWVEKTFHKKWAFAAVFFQWFQVTIGFVTMLYFIVGMLSKALSITELVDNPYIKLGVMLFIFWTVTLLQLLGNRATSLLSYLGFGLGVITPVILLVILTILYIAKGEPLAITLRAKDFIPNLESINSLVVFSTFILAYLGIEASANEIHNLKNSNKAYPKVIAIFCVTSVIINTVAGLSIALLVKDINLSTGIIEAFEVGISAVVPSLKWGSVVIACILTLSTIAKISTWIVAPSAGIHKTAKEGILPSFFAKTNKKEIPYRIIILQGLISSAWCVLLTLSSTHGDMAFLLSLALTVLIYLLAYFFMYLAYFKLTLRMENQKRSYRVAKKKSMRIAVASLGFATTIFTFIVTLFPPEGLKKSEEIIYFIVLIVSFLVTTVTPFFIYKIRKVDK